MNADFWQHVKAEADARGESAQQLIEEKETNMENEVFNGIAILNELQAAVRTAWPERREIPERLEVAIAQAQACIKAAGVEVAKSRYDEYAEARAAVAAQNRAHLESLK